ncbi:FecR family protein [Pseudomonas cremoricolorata]|uniref:Iron dicitrate transport regulator FecR n=1 Tax=Pseudomonas cremoricolorata TaxID=157783 RepID=A0A089YET7_9PSED|nr:FecR domain-containing protein [Pseudomonas cremoricolorata]AIR90243.1 iron dicitrate transport regulator FecR [Pseudomonas cremoricolorata]
MSRGALDPAAEQAIAWMVRLRSGRADARQEARFERWLAQDSANLQAWEQLQRGMGGHYEVARRAPQVLRDTLLQPQMRRRDVLRGLGGLTLLGGALWLGAHSDSARMLTADLRTGTGERRTVTLVDGSRLSLNAGTSLDIEFSANQRLLRLYQGALVIQVAPDATRPLLVRTEQGDARALGTRFLVEQLDGATRVVVLEHSVRASVPAGAWLDLAAGQAAVLRGARVELASDSQQYRADWLEGRLSVLDEPLQAVIDALRPYRPGLMRVDPEVRNLRVQGVFPLGDSERALAALEDTMPIRVRRYGSWLTLIESR